MKQYTVRWKVVLIVSSLIKFMSIRLSRLLAIRPFAAEKEAKGAAVTS